MKKNELTKYLAVFLLICIVLDGILLCFFRTSSWWNNWMAMPPIVYMILGAFYCHLMKKNVDAHPDKLTWLYVYKGIKMALTIVAVVLFIIFVKQPADIVADDYLPKARKAFVVVTASSYLVALVAETAIYSHYIKNKNKESKA
jgi:phosphoglycerol transferase MdoB-like AlkP superfamily enzyme